MIFNVVLKNGKEICCYSERPFDQIIEEAYHDSNKVVFLQENSQPEKITIVSKQNINYIRFFKKDNSTLKELKL